MRPRTHHQRQLHPRRRGLAPLEFVLSLPLLLMMMAMIIVVGTAGAWKVRTLANSRQAAARALWPRDGGNDPKPVSWWPNSATMSAGAADPAPIDDDPFARHAVVRGPFVGAQGGGGLQVNTDLLDLTRGLFAGNAAIDRDLPIWRQLPYRNRYHRETQIFSGDQWQFGPMGLGDNDSRRVDDLYPDYNLAAQSGVGVGRTAAALQALLANPQRPLLLILDRDNELRGYYGDPYESDWYRRYDRFNFHPAAFNECSTDLSGTVASLTDRINNAPCNVAQAFRRMYDEQIRAGNSDPRLQQYVQQLDQFLSQQNCTGGGTP